MNKHPRKREGITEQQIGDELYLFGTDGEKLTVLNATSSSNISNLKTANTNAQTAASPSILGSSWSQGLAPQRLAK